MVSTELSESITETIDILMHIKYSDFIKIPTNFLTFLEFNSSDSYKVSFDHSKPLNELPLKNKTKALLALIYIKYWATQDEKDELQSILLENEEKYQSDLNEKYNPNKIFDDQIQYTTNTTIEEIESTESLIEIKESFFMKIWNKLLSFLK